MDSGTVAVVGLMTMTGAELVRDLCPGLTELRQAKSSDPGLAAATHVGITLGSAIMLLTGYVVALKTKEKWPVYLSVVVALGLSAMYEWTLRRSPA